MLLALMLGIFSIAFAAEVIIGTGTNQHQHPFNSYYGYGRSLALYTMDQVGEPSSITGAGWYVQTISQADVPYKIYAKVSDDAALTAMTWDAFRSTATLVKEGIHRFDSTGWHYFTLDIPFAYTHGNLLIGVEANYGGGGFSPYPRFTYTFGAAGCHQTWQQDNTEPAGVGTVSTSMPNIWLNLAPLSDDALFILSPETWDFGHLVINDTSTKNFSIINGGGANLSITGINPVSDGFFEIVDAPSFPVELSLGERLTFGIQYAPTTPGNHSATFVINDGRSSTELEVSGRAVGETALFESFEDTFPPQGWARTTSNTAYWGTSLSYSYHESKSMYAYTSVSNVYTISTPLLEIEEDSYLNFWTLAYLPNQRLQVQYSLDRENWTQLGEDITYEQGYTWYNVELDLSSLAGENYYLAFTSPGQSQASSIFVDKVIGPNIVPVTPAAPNLTAPANNSSNMSAFPIFTWTENSSGGIPDSYNIYCDQNNPPTTLIGNTTNLIFPVSNALPYNSVLYWSVAAVNSVGEGPQATPRSFTTIFDPTVELLPWSEDFSLTTFPPANWSRFVGLYPTDVITATSAGWARAAFANLNNPIDYSARLRVFGMNAKNWLVTPPITIPGQNHHLEFDLALTTYNGSNPVTDGNQQDDRFIVLIADNPNMVDATILREWNNTGSSYIYDDISTHGAKQIIDLSEHVGIKFIAFYGESTVTGGDNGLFVDNVMVTQSPTLPVFSYTPDEIDFGTFRFDVPSDPVIVTISNHGAGTIDLSVYDISIIGPNAAEFSFDDANLPASLGTGQSVNIPVSMRSQTSGNISATLRIEYELINYDVSLSANILAQGAIIIGDGNSLANIPVYPYNYFSYSQSIYLQSEINTANKRIDKIAYYWSGNNPAPNSGGWTVYMGHTTKTAFTGNADWVPLEDLTAVYTGPEIDITATEGWIELTLTTPFIYNNVDNLVIAVDENKTLNDPGQGYFHNTMVSNNYRSLNYNHNSNNPDPASPPTGQRVAGYPNIMLQMADLPTNPVLHCSPESMDFGSVFYSEPSQPINVTVANMGMGILNLDASDLSFIGPNATEFSFTFSSLSLESGQSASFPIHVMSSTEGNISASLRISYGGENHDLALSAYVLPASLVIIGEQTTYTNGWEYPAVYGGLQMNAREQYILTAAELTAAGAQAGMMDFIAFKVQNPNISSNLPNFTIRMGYTELDDYNSSFYFVTDLTEVFNASTYTPHEGWNFHLLNEPFDWDGSSNLVIEVSFDMLINYLNNASTYYTAHPGTYKTLYYYSDYTDWSLIGSGTRSYNIPDMMLYFAAPPVEPVALPIITYPEDGATGLPVEGFDFNWLADLDNGGEPEYYSVFLSNTLSEIYDQYYWETQDTSFNPVLQGDMVFDYGQTWYWSVQAHNSAGDAVVEPPYSFVIATSAALAIPQVNIMSIDGVPTLEWEAIPGAVGYKIYTSNDAYNESWIEHDYTTETTYHYTDTQNIQFFKVIAVSE